MFAFLIFPVKTKFKKDKTNTYPPQKYNKKYCVFRCLIHSMSRLYTISRCVFICDPVHITVERFGEKQKVYICCKRLQNLCDIGPEISGNGEGDPMWKLSNTTETANR